jgi:DNA-binding LacI/PurR family transcriptional regulator
VANVLGIDVGGKNIKLGLLTAEQKVLFAKQFETRSFRARDDIITDIVQQVKAIQQEAARQNLVINKLLGKKVKPDAIFCGSDQIARGVADALREHHVRVPDDIALVGYDNWEIIASATRPSLTTVDMNIRELGRQAALQLLGLIDGQSHQGIQHLPCSLVVRESCGAKKGE